MKWLWSKIALAEIAVLIATDRMLKFFAINQWADQSLELKSWLVLGLEKNTGIAWGIASSQSNYAQPIIICCMMIAVLGIAYKGIREWCLGISPFAESLIFVGGLSNLIDRIQYAAVVDFIQIFIGNYRLSVFNLADVYILVGLAFILKKAWTHEYF